MIELRGVTKQYLYGARVLGAADITVNSGEIVALLGGVGSGKTSFLKVVAGVTDCEGEVLFDGAPLAKKPDDVVMIFDDLAQFGRRSFFYNLAYPLRIRGMSKAEAASKVYDAAARLGITACLHERAGAMPPIDRKRLSLARTLIRPAKYLLIDDITCGLSAEEAEELWGEVAPILLEKAAEGASVIFSTSRLSEALSVADRIAVMHAGEIKQLGSYDDILSRPASVWAAQAIDADFAFERVTLKQWEDGLYAVFEDRYGVNIDFLKGRIVPGYIGKEALAGWRSDAYDLSGERACRVKFALRVTDGYKLHTERGVIFSPEKRDMAGTLPAREGIFLFDARNENSVLLDR